MSNNDDYNYYLVCVIKKLKDVSVLCLECDERKIITGCSDRLIRIYDIRSGRLVSTLHGHKVHTSYFITLAAVL